MNETQDTHACIFRIKKKDIASKIKLDAIEEMRRCYQGAVLLNGDTNCGHESKKCNIDFDVEINCGVLSAGKGLFTINYEWAPMLRRFLHPWGGILVEYSGKAK